MCCPLKLTCGVALPYILICLILLFLSGVTASILLRTPDEVNVPHLAIQETSFNGTVLVVGAGAAGMFAAYTLEYLGVDYRLLEANANFGGRVQELDGFVDVPLDLGAEWIHVHPKIRQDLLLFDDEVTDNVISYQPKTVSFFRNGKLRRNNWVRFFYREFKFEETTWFSYLKDYVYPRIAEHTEFNVAVNTIDVMASDGRSYQGDRVILATPVTVIQQEDIAFVPDLPTDKRSALDSIYMTAGLKAWIEFDQRFYPDLTVMRDAEDKLYFDALFRKPSDRNVIALFEVGSSAYNRVELNETEILRSILDELDRMFDGKASRHFLKHHIQNWSQQPFIKGAYSYNTFSTGPILEPLDGRVYFCGEYLGRDHQATVHGAALSGRSAAQQLLQDFESSSLDYR